MNRQGHALGDFAGPARKLSCAHKGPGSRERCWDDTMCVVGRDRVPGWLGELWRGCPDMGRYVPLLCHYLTRVALSKKREFECAAPSAVTHAPPIRPISWCLSVSVSTQRYRLNTLFIGIGLFRRFRSWFSLTPTIQWLASEYKEKEGVIVWERDALVARREGALRSTRGLGREQWHHARYAAAVPR